MPLDSSWLYGPRVIYLHINGTVTGTDISDILDTIYHQYVDGIAPIHMIIDIDPETIVIPSLIQARQRALGKLTEKIGWTVVVNSSSKLIAFSVSLLSQLNSIQEYKNAQSLVEAVEFLNDSDPTLMINVDAALAYAHNRSLEA